MFQMSLCPHDKIWKGGWRLIMDGDTIHGICIYLCNNMGAKQFHIAIVFGIMSVFVENSCASDECLSLVPCNIKSFH